MTLLTELAYAAVVVKQKLWDKRALLHSRKLAKNIFSVPETHTERHAGRCAGWTVIHDPTIRHAPLHPTNE